MTFDLGVSDACRTDARQHLISQATGAAAALSRRVDVRPVVRTGFGGGGEGRKLICADPV
jgi:hypothetical protein